MIKDKKLHYIETVLIGAGLAMDAFAVSVTSGVSARREPGLKRAAVTALFFGGFQAIMPIIGWGGGLVLRAYIQSSAHWVAFAILTAVGLKMIYDAFKNGDNEDDESVQNGKQSIYLLFTLAVATSLDALAVGVSFSCLDYNIWEASAIIGVITFIISFIGVQLGKKLGHHLGEYRIEILGGIILIGIGAKILIKSLK